LWAPLPLQPARKSATVARAAVLARVMHLVGLIASPPAAGQPVDPPYWAPPPVVKRRRDARPAGTRGVSHRPHRGAPARPAPVEAPRGDARDSFGEGVEVARAVEVQIPLHDLPDGRHFSTIHTTVVVAEGRFQSLPLRFGAPAWQGRGRRRVRRTRAGRRRRQAMRIRSGGGGIRTPEPAHAGQRFSRPPHSTALPPLRAQREASQCGRSAHCRARGATPCSARFPTGSAGRRSCPCFRPRSGPLPRARPPR
jgi:hypothetical protein